MLAHVKLEQVEEGSTYHKLFVDETDISNIASAVNINVTAGSIPECEVTLNVMGTEFDGQADVNYYFSPNTVQQAVMVLRNELLKHGEFYDGFRASVMSAADYQFCRPDGATCDELVDAIMKRIIGED